MKIIKKRIILLLLFYFLHLVVFGTDDTTSLGKRIYNTKRLNSEIPHIDGLLNDTCWQEGGWTGGFKQFMPKEGAPATQNTEMKILYDDVNVYVAFKAYDTELEKIDFQKGRRDNLTGDIVGVCFDSYLDYRTGFGFYISAAGIKTDLLVLNSGDDMSWDAVWFGKTSRADYGWSAELLIPLSQLRYNNNEEQIWGLHAWRWLNRLQEATHWDVIPRDHSGPLYHFGQLHGINGIKKSKRVEILPYTVGKYKTYEKEEDNPYLTGHNSKFSLGVDGKIGITSDFTMDFTINPDFGQVEADPADLNLSAYETFYEEKRPFFLEGKNIFDLDAGGARLFYSRRIGQKPGRYPELDDDEYSENVENTSILGAVKFTGKAENGLSIGIIESVTAKEMVEITSENDSYDEIVEPLTNFFVGRVQKDFNKSNTILGGMITSTNRNLSEPYLNKINKSSVTGGIDFRHHWKDKTYYLDITSVFSHIVGHEDAIEDLQLSSSRYFDRPGADYLDLDTTLTSLTGFGGEIEIGKDRKGHWRYDAQIQWNSPGLDLNDIGFLRTSDWIEQETSVGYVENEPVGIFRSYSFSFSQNNIWNFGGDLMSSDLRLFFNSSFVNNWYFGGNHILRGNLNDMRILRGGPAIHIKGFWHQNYYISSDNSKRWSFNMNYHFHIFEDKISDVKDFNFGMVVRITDAFRLSSHMFYAYNKDNLQYVNEFEVDNEPLYLLATLSRKTLGMTLRLDYTITPDLTLQYYANPYISVGKYEEFKKIVNPAAKDYEQLYHIYSGTELDYNSVDKEYDIYDTATDVPDFSFENPDFNYTQLHSNFVVRWEYRPGSTLFLVWTHGRSERVTDSEYSIGNGINNLFNRHSENVFLIKFNYWFSI